MFVNLSRLGKNGTGMWQYATKFVREVHALEQLDGIICAEPHKSHFSVYGCEIITVPEWVANTSNISRLRPLLWFVYSQWLALRLMFKLNGKQVVSTTHHALPLLRNQVITIHDLRPFMQKVYFHYLLPRLLKRCSQVLTVSYTVRDKIAKCYGYDREAIHVIYNSIESSEFCNTEEKRPFLLAVGASWPHKNIHSFLRAHPSWREHYSAVIVCGNTSYADNLRQLIADFKLENLVELRHDISFSELKSLYASASALIYPSIDEGFGIPPIEAMASGTPVIVSDIPVFHEVLGEAAIYVAPDDIYSWQHAFNELSEQAGHYMVRSRVLSAKYDAENMKAMIGKWLKV